MSVVLAGLPLLVVIAALIARQSTGRSAVFGLVAAVLVAASTFGFGWADAADTLRGWSVLVIEVVLIVGGGIAFAEAGRRNGDQAVISGWLRGRLGSGLAPALAVVHGVTPLAESLTGFGVGVAISVPLLVALGFRGHRAPVIGLLGLCAVPWGAMGPGTLIAAELAQVGFTEFGVMSALLSLPVFIGAGVTAALVAGGDGRRLRAVVLATASGLVLWGSIWAANILFGTAPAGAVGAAVTLLVHLLVHRLRGVKLAMTARELRALLPYGVLLGGVLTTSVLVRLADAGDTAWRHLSSPALWLAVAVLVTLHAHLGQLRPTLRHAGATWWHVGPATGLFIFLGAVMAVSGMSDQLADALAGLGEGYLFLVPFIGGAGGFITASNSGANAMFAGPQAQAAATLGASVLPVAASQNVSASLLTMATPSRVELARRLCPDEPEMTPVLRPVLGFTLVLLPVLSVFTVLVA
ncbi:L-lactate permease [Corynebacterium halotolerans]|uniref:L-lactate permease n=1 Tax=Corynebacterium halotolerans TaxID=225326 RepID=UPI003CF0C416